MINLLLIKFQRHINKGGVILSINCAAAIRYLHRKTTNLNP